MEELRSTEVLDREILEDARKKAYRVLKTADDNLTAQTQDWDKKIQAAVNSIRKIYEDRTNKSSEEILARFPLDKRRLRSETSEAFLTKAMDDFLRSLSREKLLSILEAELSRRLDFCSEDWALEKGEKPEFLYSGLKLSEARLILKKILDPKKTALAALSRKPEDWSVKEDKTVHEFPSVVINTQSQKISASVEGAAETLIKDHRAELASALLGEGVLND